MNLAGVKLLLQLRGIGDLLEEIAGALDDEDETGSGSGGTGTARF